MNEWQGREKSHTLHRPCGGIPSSPCLSALLGSNSCCCKDQRESQLNKALTIDSPRPHTCIATLHTFTPYDQGRRSPRPHLYQGFGHRSAEKAPQKGSGKIKVSSILDDHDYIRRISRNVVAKIAFPAGFSVMDDYSGLRDRYTPFSPRVSRETEDSAGSSPMSQRRQKSTMEQSDLLARVRRKLQCTWIERYIWHATENDGPVPETQQDPRGRKNTNPQVELTTNYSACPWISQPRVGSPILLTSTMNQERTLLQPTVQKS